MVNEMKLTAFTLAFLVMACTGGNDVKTTATAAETTPPQSSSSSSSSDGPDVRLATLPPSRLGLSVAAPGTLVVDGRCLYLRAKNGTLTLPVFATFDTRWDRAAGALVVGGRTFRPGDAVTLGGSPLDAPPPNAERDPSCRGDQAFIVYSLDAGVAPTTPRK